MFNNDFCCCNVELIREDEIVNSFAGECTYRDTYACEECKRVFCIDRDEYTDEECFMEITNKAEVEAILETNKANCQECRKSFKKNDLTWVKDNHGIPYKLVCDDCRNDVEEHISNWQYDYLDAGEYLE